MKRIGFIGAFDKTDLIIYVAKLLAEMQKKVLVIDRTEQNRARYVVPCITPSQSYLTEFEGVDFAIGLITEEEVKKYLAVTTLNYDYIITDIDSKEAYEQTNSIKNDKNFFVTAFDNYSLKKGLEIIGKIQDKALMTKILFSREMQQEEDDYLNFLSFYYAVQWDKEKIYFPYDIGDSTAIIESQRTAKIKFKFLSDAYKDGLEEVVCSIEPTLSRNDIKRILRNI